MRERARKKNVNVCQNCFVVAEYFNLPFSIRLQSKRNELRKLFPCIGVRPVVCRCMHSDGRFCSVKCWRATGNAIGFLIAFFPKSITWNPTNWSVEEKNYGIYRIFLLTNSWFQKQGMKKTVILMDWKQNYCRIRTTNLENSHTRKVVYRRALMYNRCRSRFYAVNWLKQITYSTNIITGVYGSQKPILILSELAYFYSLFIFSLIDL